MRRGPPWSPPVSPFLLDYDLILLAIPLAWLTAQGLDSGFRPWEKTFLAAGFVLPAVSRNIATVTGAPIGPIVVLAVFWFLLRRWEATREGSGARGSSDRLRSDPGPMSAALPPAQKVLSSSTST
jgi:hypothetical protein